jgi:hypothetical protein
MSPLLGERARVRGKARVREKRRREHFSQGHKLTQNVTY